MLVFLCYCNTLCHPSRSKETVPCVVQLPACVTWILPSLLQNMQSGLNMNFSVVFGRNERRFWPSEVDGVSSNGADFWWTSGNSHDGILEIVATLVVLVYMLLPCGEKGSPSAIRRSLIALSLDSRSLRSWMSGNAVTGHAALWKNVWCNFHAS